jgi:leucyl aminopeptidase
MPAASLRLIPVPTDILAYRGDALILPLPEWGEPLGGSARAVDAALDGAIARLLREGAFRGRTCDRYLLRPVGRFGASHLLLVGVGKQSELTLDRVRQVTAVALREIRSLALGTAAIACGDSDWGAFAQEGVAQAIAEGALLGLYRFDRYTTSNRATRQPRALSLLCARASAARALTGAMRRGEALARAANLARDLVNEPANVLTPAELAVRARRVAREHGLSVRVLDQAAMRRLGMGALLGVAQGSANPPRLIVLRHGGHRGRGRPVLGLVGKGVTFDAGGISIKKSEGMEAMKADMAGAAAVIGAMTGIAALRMPIHVVGVIAAVENLPSGSAQRPGDVVRTMDGTTVEVISTDAEGRLILADALCYARRLGARRLVDVATLTGGVAVTLGSVRTGLFANDQVLAAQALAAGEAAGEKLWQLPLDDEYDELIESACADLKNTGGGQRAPAIGAARFLKRFARRTPWVHLDINGTALQENESGYSPRGATGVMARTLIHLASMLAAQGSGAAPDGPSPPGPRRAP